MPPHGETPKSLPANRSEVARSDKLALGARGSEVSAGERSRAIPARQRTPNRPGDWPGAPLACTAHGQGHSVVGGERAEPQAQVRARMGMQWGAVVPKEVTVASQSSSRMRVHAAAPAWRRG